MSYVYEWVFLCVYVRVMYIYGGFCFQSFYDFVTVPITPVCVCVCVCVCEQTVGLGGVMLEPPVPSEADEEEDGMADLDPEVTGLIWSQDLRVQEVQRLLQSSRPVRVNVPQLPEVSDHEYIEEKENK